MAMKSPAFREIYQRCAILNNFLQGWPDIYQRSISVIYIRYFRAKISDIYHQDILKIPVHLLI